MYKRQDRQSRILAEIELFQARERVAILRDKEVDGGLLAFVADSNGQVVIVGDIALGLATDYEVVVGRHGELRADQRFDPAIDRGIGGNRSGWASRGGLSLIHI